MNTRYAILYWDIEGTVIDGPYDYLEAAVQVMKEQMLEGVHQHGLIFKLDVVEQATGKPMHFKREEADE